jgi:hypothetical protein
MPTVVGDAVDATNTQSCKETFTGSKAASARCQDWCWPRNFGCGACRRFLTGNAAFNDCILPTVAHGRRLDSNATYRPQMSVTRFFAALLRATLALPITLTIAIVFVVALAAEAIADAASSRRRRGRRTWSAATPRAAEFATVVSRSRRPDGSTRPRAAIAI